MPNDAPKTGSVVPETAGSAGQDRVTDSAAPMFRRDAVELVLRKHLPVKMGDDVICICDARLIFEGPVGQRLHVADELRKAGLIRD